MDISSSLQSASKNGVVLQCMRGAKTIFAQTNALTSANMRLSDLALTGRRIHKVTGTTRIPTSVEISTPDCARFGTIRGRRFANCCSCERCFGSGALARQVHYLPKVRFENTTFAWEGTA
jgi:hypothetical protein